MKYLPWALLALVLAYPLFAQGTLGRRSMLNGPVKIWGQPAASDWVEIESGALGQPGTQYVVPAGKVFTMTGIYNPIRGNNGTIQVRVSVDGVHLVQAFPDEGRYDMFNTMTIFHPSGGYIAREGQLIEVRRTGGSNPNANLTGFLQGWLEDIR